MADPLSLAASLAGLVSLCETVFRHVYKYVRGVKDAKEEIIKITQELHSFTGILRSVQALAQSLEEDGDTYDPAIRVHHVYYCEQTLTKINDRMKRASQKVEKGKSRDGLMQQLKWPFSKSETHEVLEELERHKGSMNLGIGTDSMQKMQLLLSKQKETDIIVGQTRQVVRELHTEILVDARKRRVLDFFLDTETINPQTSLETNIKLRHPMTGHWLTESPVFIQWLDTPGSNIWLSGIPGGGKTVLAGAAIQETLTHAAQSSTIGAAFFFCDYKNEKTLQSTSIIGAVASQLARQRNEAFDLLHDYYDDLHPVEGLPQKPDADDLRALVEKMCEVFDQVHIVVDGIDECGDSMDEIAEMLSDLANNSGSISMSIFSRDEVGIRRQLEDTFKPITIAARSKDIELYVRAELDSLMSRGRLRVTNATLKDDIREALVDQAQGMFRWVSCQLDYLCGFSSDFERRESLGQLPPTLHETYLRVLQRLSRYPAPTQSKIQMCFQFIAFCPKRLTARQLCEAISTPATVGSHLNEDNMVSEDEIAEKCGSLLKKSADDTSFEFAHFSVREFLEHGSLGATPGLEHYQISQSECYKLLAMQSLRHLQLSNFVFDQLDMEKIKMHLTTRIINGKGRNFFILAARYSLELMKHVDFESTCHDLMLSLFHPCKTSCLVLFATTVCVPFGRAFAVKGPIAGDASRGMWFDDFVKKLLSADFRPIHLAAALNLPSVCDYLVSTGGDCEARSPFGTPFELSVASFFRLVLDCGDWTTVKTLHHHHPGMIKTLLATGTQRNATVEIFERGSPETGDSDQSLKSEDTSMLLPACIIAFVTNDFRVLQRLLSGGMTLKDSAYIATFRELMYQSAGLIKEDEQPLLEFLQHIGNLLEPESGWQLEVGRVIWNTAVDLGMPFTRDPTVTDFRISLSKDALVSRAFAAITNHDTEGLQECLADGRLVLSERHRDPREPHDEDDPEHLTLLHFAVLENNLRATEVLAQAGCDPNIFSVQLHHRYPPIHDCCSIDIFEELLAHGAQATEVKTYTGENIWHLYGRTDLPKIEFFNSLARRYPSETAEALLAKSKDGHTPLQSLLISSPSSMSREDHVDRAMTLLAICHGAVDFWSRHGPLFAAAATLGSGRVTSRLIEVGAGTETIGPGLETPLHCVSFNSSSAAVQCLKEVFPEAVHIRYEGQLPLQSYLEKCLHDNNPIDDSVTQQLWTAESVESIDGRGTSLWEYYCNFNSTSPSIFNQTAMANLWAWLLGKNSAMQVYEKDSGKNGLILILSRLIALEKTEDLISLIPSHILNNAMDATDCWETIKSHSNVLRFLQFAIKKRAYSLVSILIARGVSVHDQVDGYSSMQIAFQSPLVVALSSDEDGKSMLLAMLDQSTTDHLNGYDRDGLTILHSLATSDSVGGQGLQWLIGALVHRGVDVNRFGSFQDNCTPMVYHIKKGSVFCATYLLEIGADPGLAAEHYADAALEACWWGSTTFLRKLLDHSRQTGMLIDWGRKMTFFLKSRDGFGIKVSDANAAHLLSMANLPESLEILQFYVDNGLSDDLDYASNNGWTAMHCAAFCGNAQTIEYLSSRGRRTMPETDDKSTPLHLSVRKGHYEATKVLIRLGAKDIPDSTGMTPSMYASRINNTSIRQLLGELSTPEKGLARGFSRDALPRNRSKALINALEKAIVSDDIQECKRLYSLNCPLNGSVKGWSPLLLALYNARLHIAEWLLDNGAITTTRAGQGITQNINVIDICLGHPKLCKLLSELIDRCIHDGSGWPLFGSSGILSAILNRNAEGLSTLFKLLQDRAADISTVANIPRTEVLHRIVNKVFRLNREDYGTALHFAALKNNVPAAHLLLEHGAAINEFSFKGYTALRMASSPEMIALLVRHGASLIDHFSNGWFDCTSWSITLFKNLVSAHSEAKTKQDQVDIPTFLPTMFHTRGSIRCSNLFISPFHLVSLLKAGLDLTLESGSEISPMHLAIADRASSTFVLNSNLNLENMTPLPYHLEFWQDICFLRSMFRHFRRRLAEGDFVRIANLQPARGWSPLCLATRDCRMGMIRNCLCLGADVDFEGSPYGSALILACASGSLRAVRLLVQAGASLSYQGQNGHRSVFTFCRSKSVRRWLLVERFTEQRRIDTRSLWENGERVRPWAGTAIARLKLVGDRAMFYHETLMEYAGRLARMRKRWHGNVIPSICIDGVVYKS